MNIPVYVQLPNKPDTAQLVSSAPDTWTAEQIARALCIPDDCFVSGKIISRRQNADKGRHWSIVSLITVSEGTGEKDWIVITGHPIDTTTGGGFEYDGPFTEAEAQAYRDYLKEVCQGQEFETVIIQVQLLNRGRRWLDAHKKEGSP